MPIWRGGGGGNVRESPKKKTKEKDTTTVDREGRTYLAGEGLVREELADDLVGHDEAECDHVGEAGERLGLVVAGAGGDAVGGDLGEEAVGAGELHEHLALVGDLDAVALGELVGELGHADEEGHPVVGADGEGEVGVDGHVGAGGGLRGGLLLAGGFRAGHGVEGGKNEKKNGETVYSVRPRRVTRAEHTKRQLLSPLPSTEAIT